MTTPNQLLVLDVEGTLFESSVALVGTDLTSTIWQGLARALGDEAEVDELETHRRWAAGEYASYLEWMRATIEIHIRHGLTREVFEELVNSAPYRPAVEEVVRAIDREEYEIVLITGGFRELARRAQRDLRIHHTFAACEYLFGENDNVVGYNLLPCDFAGKLDFVRLMLREYGLSDRAWTFVGDGANDVEIARAAPYSIGITPHVALRAVVDRTIDSFTELPALLASKARWRQ